MAPHPHSEAPVKTLSFSHRILISVLLLFAMSTPAAASEREEAIEHGLGVAMASALYHTHLFIAATSDAFAKGAYDGDQVQEMLKASAAVTFSMVKSLEDQVKFANDDKERALLQELLEICQDVITEARLLAGYATTSDPKMATSFTEKQRIVKGRISRLLAL